VEVSPSDAMILKGGGMWSRYALVRRLTHPKRHE